MPHPNVNLQDSFLNQVRKDNVEVTIRLLDGTQLRGVVRGFDNFTVILQVDGEQHLVYKHAMAHIASSQPVRTAPAAPGNKKRGDSQTPGAGAHPSHRNRKPASSDDGETNPSRKKNEKFNTLDFSNIQIPESPQASGE